MAADAIAALRAASYVLLTTFKRDGTGVPTAVWAVPDGEDALLVWTGRSTGKVKRLRHTRRVTLAPCTRAGRPTGEAVEATAVLLDEAGTIAVQEALIRRYGWLARFLVRRALRTRGQAASVGIRITLPV